MFCILSVYGSALRPNTTIHFLKFLLHFPTFILLLSPPQLPITHLHLFHPHPLTPNLEHSASASCSKVSCVNLCTVLYDSHYNAFHVRCSHFHGMIMLREEALRSVLISWRLQKRHLQLTEWHGSYFLICFLQGKLRHVLVRHQHLG